MNKQIKHTEMDKNIKRKNNSLWWNGTFSSLLES